ncbi:hypothetical protein HPT25_23375 [Bacillus sp. BRMEA1]|uniref:DUF5659 domain-containing protein n=1 Tax=Neobacillus endophyticus TaxID=2738405 RepID=UPI001566F83A|nr:DUF5659 domain-containing protein [Neobacillus endophyticus]NRD80267.1 hypothetical protein [Neobacillus endophyticus]
MVIYSQQMAAKLMLKGFVLQGMDKNQNKSGKNIFYFNDSDELRKVMSELSKTK